MDVSKIQVRRTCNSSPLMLTLMLEGLLPHPRVPSRH